MSLIDYLPDYYKDVKEFKELINSEDVEVNSLKDAINEVGNQLFVDTATWGLSLWERDLGLTYDTDLGLDERRSRIKSKQRGIGDVDDKLIKDVADAWTNGDVVVTFSNGSIGIQFTSVVGIPSRINDVKKAIREITPAHLEIVYAFAYLLIKDIDSVITINDLELITLDKFAGGE